MAGLLPVTDLCVLVCVLVCVCVRVCLRVCVCVEHIIWIGNSDGQYSIIYMSPGNMPFSFLFPRASDPVFFGAVVFFSSLFFFYYYILSCFVLIVFLFLRTFFSSRIWEPGRSPRRFRCLERCCLTRQSLDAPKACSYVRGAFARLMKLRSIYDFWKKK